MQNQQLSYYYQSPIGIIEIKANENAITYLQFIQSTNDTKIEENKNQINEYTNKIVKKCKIQLDAYFEGAVFNFSIPVAQYGTEFQQNVWDKLCDIDYGKTSSYLELSKRINNVKAVRAVGAANGKNNILLLIPCHRVIGNNGNLVGYAGDLWRKKWLLNHEAKYANGVQPLF